MSVHILTSTHYENEFHIKLKYVNDENYKWINIRSKTYIRPNGSNKQLFLIRAEGIAYSPKKNKLSNNTDVVLFTLIFPSLPENTRFYDLIENEKDTKSFNLYNIKVNKSTISHTPATIYANIEQLAEALKTKTNKKRLFEEECTRLTEHLSPIAEQLKINKNEAFLFGISLYLSSSHDKFSLSEIIRYCNFCFFDVMTIKELLKSMVRRGWFTIKRGNNSFFGSGRRAQETYYCIATPVITALNKGQTPQPKQKTNDLFTALDELHIIFEDHSDMGGDFLQLCDILNEFETEFPDLSITKISVHLQLNNWDKAIYFYMISMYAKGIDVVDMERMLRTLLGENFTSIRVKQYLKNCESKLFSEKIIEFADYLFKSQQNIRLTDIGVEKSFSAEAGLFVTKEKFTSDLIKLINLETISEKKLFYNKREEKEIERLENILQPDKHRKLLQKLQENNMKHGFTVLLHGAPGTGKTETVYQIARKTGRCVMLINISDIRDKYVGESEKRIKSVFTTYRKNMQHHDNTPILLFNESDALISKRIRVSGSVDQMNNVMQNILLQELENFAGILIATTNLTQNLDKAFERRFLFKIQFEKPCKEARKEIYKQHLPFLSDSDAMYLAEKWELSGGQIENIARKSFIDALISENNCTIELIEQFCEAEILGNKHEVKRMGFV